MKWYINMKIRSKMFLSLGILFVLAVITIGLALVTISEISDSQKTMNNVNVVDLENMYKIESGLHRNLENIHEMMGSNDVAAIQKLLKKIDDEEANINTLLTGSLKLNSEDTAGTRLLKRFETNWLIYTKQTDEEIKLINTGKLEDAKLMGDEIHKNSFEKLINDIFVVANRAKGKNDSIYQSNQKQITKLYFIAVGLGSLDLIDIIAILWSIITLIGIPLTKITVLTEKVSEGDFNVAVESVDRKDEIGILMRTFQKMVDGFKDMSVSANRMASGDLSIKMNNEKHENDTGMLTKPLRQMEENLRKITIDTKEAVNLLNTSASEILASTAQLASGASETSSAITETTTTVEEVKQTSQLATQKAKMVSDTANNASQISVGGKKSVEETMIIMNRIHEQMELVAETIVRLSEQSQSIGEIAATVNDLAEQSNLLAVNAAIEAAKAGEQGKGFAVVAQEVKSLAEQSKQATAQVRVILNDVQKSISAAVMATEQGSKAVESGVKQSKETGESISNVMSSISETSQAATQILATTQQQIVGMNQVAQAMENIKQASIQSLSSTKQVEMAARNLNEMGIKLKQLIEQYKV